MSKPYHYKSKDEVVESALHILESQAKSSNDFISSPKKAANMFKLKIGNKKREHFTAAFFTTSGELIKMKTLFKGSLSSSEVHPRVIAEKALKYNASSIIISHNHPSGNCKPSDSDLRITRKIKQACDLFDINVIDHIIVTKSQFYSLTEEGLI